MTKPEFTREISFGQIAQIVTMVFIAGSVIGVTQLQVNANAAVNEDQETRLRVVELQLARTQEQYSNIIGGIARIDGRLERIEDSK